MIKLFTHTDLDGISCILLAQLAFGKDAVDFEVCRHEEINDKLCHYIEDNQAIHFEHCFVTDIAMNDEVAKLIDEKLNASSEHLTLIDHHISAIHLNAYPWSHVIVTDDKGIKASGTSLFYQTLCTKQVPYKERLEKALVTTFVEKVRRYDTWDWQGLNDIESKQLNDLFSILGLNHFLDHWFQLLEIGTTAFEFDETQKLLLEIRQNEIDDYILAREEELFTREIAGYKVGIVFANRFQSELGNKLALLHPEYDFIAMINMGGGVSCRTVKDTVNLAEITALFGGGGHAKAAGLPISNDIRESVINMIFHLNQTIKNTN